MFKKIARLFIVIAFLTGCNDHETTDPKYLNEVMDIMEENSINRHSIDWPKFRADVIASANGGNSEADINRALSTALTNLNDHHSFIVRGGVGVFSNNGLSCSGNSAGFADVPDNIGYVKVPGFSGTEVNAFATSLQDKIRAQDNEDIIGWIIDLRGNTGGNMWPMLAGIGPVLGYDIAGYFIDPDGNESDWRYNVGNAMAGVNPAATVSNPYILINNGPKVAVLTDQQTASSGEAIAVAFIGRAKTRSFGTATCGLSTANAGFSLSDGATLQLTIAVMADRNKNKKGGPLVPDVTVAGDQQVVNKAVEWLNEP